MIGSGLAGDIGELLIWRFIAGAGSGMYMTGAIIYLSDIATPQNRARLIGTNQAAIWVGVSIGPAIGGLLADDFGFRVPFYVVGVAAFFTTIYAYLRLPETHRRRPTSEPSPATPARSAWRVSIALLRSRDFFVLSLVTFGSFFTRTAGRQTIVPLLGTARLGLSAGSLGAVFSLMAVINVILIVPAAIMADRFGRRAVIVPGGLIAMAGLFVYGQSETVLIFVVAAVVLSLGEGLAGPAPSAYAADISPPDSRGLAMGLHRTTGDIGFVIGPPLLGWLADSTSFGWALSANAILVGVAAVLFGLLAREHIHRATPSRATTSPTTRSITNTEEP
jgi:MFS family permease